MSTSAELIRSQALSPEFTVGTGVVNGGAALRTGTDGVSAAPAFGKKPKMMINVQTE